MTDAHLDPAMLAEYDEGLLAPPQTIQLEEHLARCSACAGTLQHLGEVRARLAGAPAEVPLPPAVAARIDDALAAEQERRRAPAQRPVATIHPFRRRLPRLLAAAAAVAAVGFGGYVVATTSGGSESAGGATTAESADRAASGADEAAGSAGGRQGSTDESAPVAPKAQRSSLDEEIKAVVAGRDSGSDRRGLLLADDCGQTLARELGRALIGAAPTDLGQPGAVLVVVQANEANQVMGYVLPACDARAGDALTELTVAVE